MTNIENNDNTDKVLELYKSGKPMRKIANELEVPYNEVREIIRSYATESKPLYANPSLVDNKAPTVDVNKSTNPALETFQQRFK